jgi:uracil phosphoribosyltransferase
VIATIIRAGLPVQHGLKQVFDEAELAFVAAGRKPETPAGVEIDLAYTAAPSLEGKVLIIGDTMLATGKSLVDSYNALVKSYGKPKQTYVVAVVGSKQGVAYAEEHIPGMQLFICAVDTELNDKFYIVPGLGDAGDLLYGEKQAKAS